MSKTQTNGLTLSWDTSSWSADIVNYSKDGETADDVETSDLSTTGYRTYEGGELIEGGTYSFLFHVDPEKTPLTTGTTDRATITYPISNPANATNGTRAFDAYINSYSESGEINGLIQGTVQIKVAGNITFTAETT
jgi:hypothetical protein